MPDKLTDFIYESDLNPNIKKQKDSVSNIDDFILPSDIASLTPAKVVNPNRPVAGVDLNKKKYYDASRLYFEHGQLPWTSLLIPGHQNMLEAPKPPGGYDKSGKPLDEGGKPYKVKSFPKWLRDTTSNIYTEFKAVSYAVGKEINDIGVDLYKAIDKTVNKNTMLSKVLNRVAIVPEATFSVGTGILSTVASEGVKQMLIAEGMDRDDAVELAGYKASKTTYQPVTEGGEALAELANKVLGYPIYAIHKTLGEPIKQMVEQSVVGNFITWLKGKPEMFGETIDTAITLFLVGKGFSKGTRSIKGAGKAIKTALEAKRIETYNKYVPSVEPPVMPPIVMPPEPVMPDYKYISEKDFEDVKSKGKTIEDPLKQHPMYDVAKAVEDAEAKIYGSGLSEDIDLSTVEKAQARIDEVIKMQSDLSNKEKITKAVIDTQSEEIIKEELKIKGEKVKEIKTRLKSAKIEVKEDITTEPKDKIVTETKTSLQDELTELRKKFNNKEIKTGEYIKENKRIQRLIDIEEAAKEIESITRLDELTGTPRPEGLNTESSPFRDKSKKHTDTLSKLYSERIKSVSSSPETYTRYLVNEVNRYLNGEDISIGKIRDSLSELSVRADELGNHFDVLDHFYSWKETVNEAAKWAREADRLKIEQTGKGTKLTMGVDPTDIKRLFKGFHGTSSKYIKPEDVVGKYLKPKSLKRIVEDTLDELKLSGKERDDARQKIYDYDYFSYAIEKGKSSRPFDEKEVYIAKKFKSAASYAEWAGEAYDNALVALGAFDKKPTGVAKKALEIFNKNREAKPYVLEVEVDKTLKEGDSVFDKPVKVIGVYDSEGTKLYINPLMDKTTFIKLGQNAARGMRKAQELKEFSIKTATKLLRKKYTASLVERSGNTARILSNTPGNVGYELKASMYLSRGGHPKALRVFEQMRNEVDSGLSANEKYIKHGLIKFARVLDIAKYKSTKKFTFPKDSSPAEAAAYIEGFRYKKINGIRDLTDKEAHRLYHIKEDGSIGGRVGAYFDWTRKVIKDVYEDGLISEQEMKDLTSHNYGKIKNLVDIFDKEEEIKLGSKTLTIYDSGIERLAKGKFTDVYELDSNILALETFNTLYSRMFKNRANRDLYDLALEDKSNPFVRVKESKSVKIPEDFRHYTAKVFIEGKPKTIFLHDSIGPEWITSNAQITYKYGQFIRYITGTPLVKTFATGINQTFAFRNLPRDAFQLWFTSRIRRGEPSKVFGKYQSTFSPTMPIAAYQLLRQYKRVFRDTVLRTGRFNDYIDDGGGMELLTPQGKILFHGKHLEPAMEAFYKYASYLGTTSELLTRHAIRDKVIETRAKDRGISFEEASKDKKIRKEATFAARDYMDFLQGGDIIKAVDNGIPYINAKLVAMRTFLRSFKDQPIVSVYKLTQFAMLVTGVYVGNQMLHPDTMKDLEGDRRTSGSLVFPLGDMFGFKDSMNETRYPFIMVPINQDMKFFKTLFEGGIDLMHGKPVDADRIVQSLKDFAPADVTTLPPTISGSLGYAMNKDFWLGKNIVPESQTFKYEGPEWLTGKKGSGYEFDKNTSQAAKDLGYATGISPKRLKYLMGQLITNDNMYAQILGKGYQEAFGQLPKKDREFILAESLSKVPIIKAFFGITNPYTKFASSIEQAKDKAELDRFIENTKLDVMVDAYLNDETIERPQIDDYINSFKSKDIRDRLKDRFKFQEKTKGLPNHNFWLNLKSISSIEERAKEYIKRIDNATPKELDEIMGVEEPMVRRAGGILTPEFMHTVSKIRSEMP